MVDTSVVQGEEEEEEEAEQEADRRNDRTIVVPMDDVNVADLHSSQGGETDDTPLCSSAEEGNNWPEEDYSPDNVNGRLPDPDGDTGSESTTMTKWRLERLPRQMIHTSVGHLTTSGSSKSCSCLASSSPLSSLF
jgi:hypothetical protein